MAIYSRDFLGVVARALPRGFELHDRPARLHIAQAHPLGGYIKMWGENNTHEFHPKIFYIGSLPGLRHTKEPGYKSGKRTG